jgi:hypothetical protein
MTDQPRQLATVRDYAQLHQVLRARADELGITRTAIDDTGFTAGHASKLLAPRPIKRLGATTLGLMLRGLGVMLVVAEDPIAMARITADIPKRNRPAPVLAVTRVRHKDGKHVLISKRFLRKIARAGGRARAQNLTPVQRSRIAREAARVRWQARLLG